MPRATHRIEQTITRVTLWMLVVIGVASFIGMLFLLQHGSAAERLTRLMVPLAVVVACGVAFLLTQRGQARIGAALVILTAYVGVVFYVILAQVGLHSAGVPLFALMILGTALLLGHRAGLWATAIALITVVVLYNLEVAGLLVNRASVAAIPLLNIAVLDTILFGASGLMVYSFSRAFHETVLTASEQEQRFRQLLDVAPLGYVMHRDGKIVTINRVAAAFSGYQDPDRMIGMSVYEFLPAHQRAMARARMDEARSARPGSIVNVEFRMRNPEGEVRVLETVTAQAELADGPALLTVLRDVTREREAAAALADARDAAEAASRAKSRFLANMSHEIRTPMNAVIGLSELLLESQLSVQQRERAAGIRSAAQALLGVINDILDVSRIEAGRLALASARFDPMRMMQDLRDLLQPLAAAKSIETVLETGPGVPMAVLGDEGRLRQILLNLAANAVKFTDRGEVRLTVDVLDAQNEEVRLRFRVIDTGIGMSAAELDTAFEPFVQADADSSRRHGGTGLGLHIARELSRLMGGTLEARSTPGEGSCFELQVPLKRAAAADLEAVAPAVPMARQGPLELLLVEDNDINQEVARAMLESAGHRVQVAADGAQAVRLCASNRFDCVLMDCQMPGMDGFEATRTIRAEEAMRGAPRVPIVALTANAMAGDRERCLAAGMDDFLAKPFDGASLRAIVARNAVAGTPAASGPVAPPAHSGFDPRAIAELEQLDRETPGFLNRLVDRFVAGTPALIANVAEASPASPGEAERAAHSLKSTSARFGALALSALASRAELAARAGDLDTARGCAEAMREEFERVCEQVRAHPAIAGRVSGS